MPRLKNLCAICGKKIPQKDYEAGMVVTSWHTKRRWCAKCTKKRF